MRLFLALLFLFPCYSAEDTGVDLGTVTVHAIDQIREAVIQYDEKGQPVRVMIFRHVVNADTGAEISRSPETIVRVGESLEADAALKTVAAALPKIGDRLNTEDQAVKAADLAAKEAAIAADQAAKAAEAAAAVAASAEEVGK